MNRYVAYCYATGRIGFGRRCPKGTLPIIRGSERGVRKLIQATARHAYDGKTLLVPGVPEAENQNKGVDALLAFTKWIEGHLLLKPYRALDVRSARRIHKAR